MVELTLSRQQRHLKRLSDELDAQLAADRRYFERRPDRRHRVRRAFRHEVEIHDLASGVTPRALPSGHVWHTVVRVLCSGVRGRLYIPARSGTETDLDEATAAGLWERAGGSTTLMRKVEDACSEIALAAE